MKLVILILSIMLVNHAFAIDFSGVYYSKTSQEGSAGVYQPESLWYFSKFVNGENGLTVISVHNGAVIKRDYKIVTQNDDILTIFFLMGTNAYSCNGKTGFQLKATKTTNGLILSDEQMDLYLATTKTMLTAATEEQLAAIGDLPLCTIK
jgi:hypothetical protein